MSAVAGEGRVKGQEGVLGWEGGRRVGKQVLSVVCLSVALSVNPLLAVTRTEGEGRCSH